MFDALAESNDDDIEDAVDLSEEAMRRAEQEGLIRSESLDLFLMWRSLGGMNQGISLTELLTVDGWIIQDFVWLLGQQHKARKRKKARDKVRKEMGSAKADAKRRRH